MRFVSYAQNFEDIMLFRALKDVEEGLYIDVGAQDPNHCSVTKAFYERGWRGVNFEPVHQYFTKLIQDRPEDLNLDIAAGERVETKPFYEIPNTGLSTFNSAIAKKHAADGWPVAKRMVQVRAISDVLTQYHLASHIHFLKVDVEGTEAMVLRGLNLSIHRPWIIVVEATEPLTQTPTYPEWESLLQSNKYDFVYFDGLNRFYLANEHQELSIRLKVPPNFFDEFILEEVVTAQGERDNQAMQTKHWHREYQKTLENMSALREQHEITQAQLATIKESLNSILLSRSWRFTAPLRMAMELGHRLKGNADKYEGSGIGLWHRLANFFKKKQEPNSGHQLFPSSCKNFELENLNFSAEAGNLPYNLRTQAESGFTKTTTDNDPREDALDGLLMNIRLQILDELNRHSTLKKNLGSHPLELQLRKAGLHIEELAYPMNALEQLPQPQFLESLSLLLFKRSLEDSRLLRTIGAYVNNQFIILLWCTILPGRKARMPGMFKYSIRYVLSRNPYLFSLAKKIHSHFR